ncbi:subtilisin-like protease SBT6.1 isoform X2 [Selaginella moellendorffii]|uniref:subtilisin-like protease SBT6.1 isoform X2 n=1 Tax=Selaginella moellendorffii TaxID=88036 RepID=UPI000D1CACA5|nr:subtilisin-like protease SBT6.1 isoform X2 [Selaginella moellendorffii]|eukprot:XP_024539020.1 subtilisin-like protease SBT6.1 isoform X2 [Selaginella moellendorffii]
MKALSLLALALALASLLQIRPAAVANLCDALDDRQLRITGNVSSELIVRFREYRHASIHKRALLEALHGVSGWEWIDRNNPAAAFPTDFGLVRVEDGFAPGLEQHLRRVSFVLDVSPQMRFTRSPLAEGKPPGRLRTGFSHDEQEEEPLLGNVTLSKRHLLIQRSQITSMFGAEKLWAKGFTGAKVKMAVFDTGVRSDHPHFRDIKERTNWTNEDTLNDNLGHGTFVAGVISSQDPQCLGFAPDAEIYAFRVFTDAQVSYTSWFLDAFNYAIATRMNILNLSIGGPDYLDRPFVEKVWELTANNIIMVSAIGNDGPLYGTLNNPADQNDVIGVGGIDHNDHISSFSSRGMSTWEIPHGYGRIKPDIVAYGRDVFGSKITSGCKSLSGTSVASPVVAGAVCLLASVVPESVRWSILNPASMKQALVEGATRLNGPNMYEQGAGRLNLLDSYEILVNYRPRASVMPAILDFTSCNYAWPFCRQPLYADAMPTMFNATILNGMGVIGYLESLPIWIPGQNGQLLNVRVTHSTVIWPWTGYLGIYLEVTEDGASFTGVAEGNITFTVVSPPAKGENQSRRSSVVLPVRVPVIPTPPRARRILWDQFHSIRYPPGYIPRDSLDVRNDILDWHADHLHTNFHAMFDALRDAGYYLETLGSPLTCFEARNYGTLLMVDLEDEFYPEEIDKLQDDVERHGLGVIVFADWYHVDTIVKMKFFDDNTRSWWTPATGGANVPALNDLLAPFGIAFGDSILNGAFSLAGERSHYASGTDIRKFPAGGFIHRFTLQDNSAANKAVSTATSRSSIRTQVESPVLGAVTAGNGRLAVYGDSNCLDSSHMVTNCYWLLRKLLDFTSDNVYDPALFSSSNELSSPLGGPDTHLPLRRPDVNLTGYSLVLGHKMQCGSDAPTSIRQAVYDGNRDRRLHRSLPQRQPMDNSINLSSEGTRPANLSLAKKQSTMLDDRHQRHYAIGKTARNQTGHVAILPVFWTRDELESPVLVAVHWFVPLLLCITGFILTLSLWRVRQRRRRKARKNTGTRLLIF